MPLLPQEISVELASDVLVDFIREHSGSASFKKYSAAIGYRTWFFTPQKKLALFEELFFLHYALAKTSISNVQAERSTKAILRTIFQYKVQKKFVPILAKDDPSFVGRFKQHAASYEDLLESGGDAIGLSSTFLSQLYRDLSKSLNLKESMNLLPILFATHKLIVDVAMSMNVREENDDDDLNLFKRKDETVGILIERIEQCKKSAPEGVRHISDPLFDTLSGAVKSQWTSEHIANYKAQIQAGESHEAFIYNFIIHECGDRLESGRHHVYRGVLNSEGHLYLQLFEHAITTMIEKGEYTKEWANENLRGPVLKGIKEMG